MSRVTFLSSADRAGARRYYDLLIIIIIIIVNKLNSCHDFLPESL